MTPKLCSEDKTKLASKSWRLNNLYTIVGKNGLSIPFKLNEIQESVLKSLHTRNIILKARQVGMTTFSVLYMLDEAMFNANKSVGIVSYSLEHSQHIFKRIIGHSLDNLAPYTSMICPIKSRSARELTFFNGSFLRVDTTLRGGTYNSLLVSEFGKTCARNPLKAEEVITGTLESASEDSLIIVESTGEGNSGYYADMVSRAKIENPPDCLNILSYKLFFFPWYLDKSYSSNLEVSIGVDLADYFSSVEKQKNISLTKKQKNWYASKKQTLGEKVKQEYPSTEDEAFLASSEGFYFQKQIEELYKENRAVSVDIYDPLESVYVSMDIGVSDETVILFFQVVHREVRVLDFYHANGLGAVDYATFLLNEKKYRYHTIFLPHDAKKRDGIIVENSYEREFRKLFSHTEARIIVLKQTDKNISICAAQVLFKRCVFNLTKTKKLIDMLYKYKKKWSEQHGQYLNIPLHNFCSNFADGFIYMAQALAHIEAGSNQDAHKKHREMHLRKRVY